MFREDRRQYQGDGARFSGAGGADHGEIFREQLVDEDECRPQRVMVKSADGDVRDRWSSVDGRQIGFGRGSNGRAGNRVM